MDIIILTSPCQDGKWYYKEEKNIFCYFPGLFKSAICQHILANLRWSLDVFGLLKCKAPEQWTDESQGIGSCPACWKSNFLLRGTEKQFIAWKKLLVPTLPTLYVSWKIWFTGKENILTKLEYICDNSQSCLSLEDRNTF